jgi:hypothetical protein
MLPPFIIEQIRQREQREREKREDRRPHLELPIEHVPARRHDEESADDEDRGVIIVDLMS